MMLSDGRIKSSLHLDKLTGKQPANYEKLSPASRNKMHKRSEDVDFQKMLIEQYQQSNALLAQNINTLLLLNQQAAAGQVSNAKQVLSNTTKSPAVVALVTSPPVTPNVNSTSVSYPSSSKQIIDQAKSKTKHTTSLQNTPISKAITTKSYTSSGANLNRVNGNRVNGVITVSASNVLSLRSTVVSNNDKKVIMLHNQVKGNLQSQLSHKQDKGILSKSCLSGTSNASRSHTSLNQDKNNDSRSQLLNQEKTNVGKSQLSRKPNDSKQDTLLKKDQGLGDITEFLRQQSQSPAAQILSQSRGNSKLFLNTKLPVPSGGKQTSPTSVKSRNTSQTSPSASIMRTILNAKLPKMHINDPRLSAERISKKNSLSSNLSDSGDSVFSTSGNIADLLDDSFIKSRRLSMSSDKSDISDKSNERRSSKSPLKPEAPRLTLSEYQQRRKEAVKPTTPINAINSSASKLPTQPDAFDLNIPPNVPSTVLQGTSEKTNPVNITNFTSSECSKITNDVISIIPNSTCTVQRNSDPQKSSYPIKCNPVRSNGKYTDDDFFIPRKASTFLYRDLPEPVSCANETEEILEHNAGLSDGGGAREIRKISCENAESDTSTNVQKRRHVNIHTDTESTSRSKARNVRVDDDIEYEYQAFLKSIGVTLKSNKKRAKHSSSEKTNINTETLANMMPVISVPENVCKNDGLEDTVNHCKAINETKIGSKLSAVLPYSINTTISSLDTDRTSTTSYSTYTHVGDSTTSDACVKITEQSIVQNINEPCFSAPTNADQYEISNVISTDVTTAKGTCEYSTVHEIFNTNDRSDTRQISTGSNESVRNNKCKQTCGNSAYIVSSKPFINNYRSAIDFNVGTTSKTTSSPERDVLLQSPDQYSSSISVFEKGTSGGMSIYNDISPISSEPDFDDELPIGSNTGTEIGVTNIQDPLNKSISEVTSLLVGKSSTKLHCQDLRNDISTHNDVSPYLDDTILRKSSENRNITSTDSYSYVFVSKEEVGMETIDNHSADDSITPDLHLEISKNIEATTSDLNVYPKANIVDDTSISIVDSNCSGFTSILMRTSTNDSPKKIDSEIIHQHETVSNNDEAGDFDVCTSGADDHASQLSVVNSSYSGPTMEIPEPKNQDDNDLIEKTTIEGPNLNKTMIRNDHSDEQIGSYANTSQGDLENFRINMVDDHPNRDVDSISNTSTSVMDSRKHDIAADDVNHVTVPNYITTKNDVENDSVNSTPSMEDNTPKPLSFIFTDNTETECPTMKIDDLPLNPDSTPLIVPPDLSKLEQLASVAMIESQGPHTSYPKTTIESSNNATAGVISPFPRASLKDLPFLLNSAPYMDSYPSRHNKNNNLGNISNIPNLKTSKKNGRPSKIFRKKRKDRVKSKRIIIDEELSPEAVTESETSLVAAGTVEPLQTNQISLSTTVVAIQPSAKPIKHSQTAKPRGSHSCSICGKHFTLARLLTSHIKRDHSGEIIEADQEIPIVVTTQLDENQLMEENTLEITIENEEKKNIAALSNEKKMAKARITEKTKKTEKGRKTRSVKKTNMKELQTEGGNDSTRVEDNEVKTDDFDIEEGSKGDLYEKIPDDKSELKIIEMIDEKIPIKESLDIKSSSKNRRIIKRPDGSLGKSRQRKKKTDNLKSPGDIPNVSKDVNSSDASMANVNDTPTSLKPSKNIKNSKDESKTDNDKQKISDVEENNGRIADSIRTKIQKLLSRSDSSSDTIIEPTSGSPQEGIGKRQSKATLKKKAFMEELHSQKSRRKRVKPQVNPIPQIMEITAGIIQTKLNTTADNESLLEINTEQSIPNKNNAIISSVSMENEDQPEVMEEAVAPDVTPLPSQNTMQVENSPNKEMPSELTLENMVKTVMSNPPIKRKYKCKICSSEFWKEQELTKHALKHNQRIYDCYKCDENFTTMRALTKHLLVHDGVGTTSSRCHDCERCGYKCETENQLIVHKKIHEIKETEHACTLCSTKYHHLKELYTHIARWHPEGMQQVLRCSHCEECFNSIPEFRKHLILLHTMNKKQAAVACKNKGILPEEFKRAEEEKKRMIRERQRMLDEKKRAKGLLLRSGVLKMDKGKDKNALPRKKDVVRKAKEVIQKSRKVKMNLRRDAALLASDPKAQDNNSASTSVSTTSPTLPVETNVTSLTQVVAFPEMIDMPNDITDNPTVFPTDTDVTGKSDLNDTAKTTLEGTTERKLRKHGKSDEDNVSEPKREKYERKTRLPIGILENIFDRVQAMQQAKIISSNNIPKLTSRQNSKEELKSPNSNNKTVKESSRDDLKLNHDKKKENSKDELKINMKSPTHDKKEHDAMILQDISPTSKKSIADDFEKLRSEEEQKQIKLKFESAERTARMLIRNQRRTSDGSQNRRSRKYSERTDVSPVGTPTGSMERIEPIKVKVHVKMTEFDAETTARVVTSPDQSDNNNDLETTKKASKRKGKRKSGKGSNKDFTDGTLKTRKRTRLSTHDDKPIDDSFGGFDSPFEGNISLPESQHCESDETPFLLPGGIDFDKEYDYKNQTNEKTFLTEDDLMSSLMTLADCAVDAHMIELKDVCTGKIDDDVKIKVDDDVKVKDDDGVDEEIDDHIKDIFDDVKDVVDNDVKEKIEEMTNSVCITLTENKPVVTTKLCLDLKIPCSLFSTTAEDCSQFPNHTPGGEQGNCFTPTPTLDHDYFGNIDQISSTSNIDDNVCKSESHCERIEPEIKVENITDMEKSNKHSFDCFNQGNDASTHSKETLLRLCDISNDENTSEKKITEECKTKDELPKYQRKLRKRSGSRVVKTNSNVEIPMSAKELKYNIDFFSEQIDSTMNQATTDQSCESNETNDNSGMTSKTYEGGIYEHNSTPIKEIGQEQYNTLDESDSVVSGESSNEKSEYATFQTLYDNYDSDGLTTICSATIRKHTIEAVRKRRLESDENFDAENWTVPESSSLNTSFNRFDCSDVVIKTEEDTFDIDVQATDLDDIVDLNKPYEEINNNFNEREENPTRNSVKFYSCDNNVRDDEIDYLENDSDNSQPNNDVIFDTDTIELSSTLINKSVSDLIAQSDGIFYCLYCRKKFRKESSVKQHTLTHTNSIKHPFKCLYCPSSFRKCSQYINHKSVHLSVINNFSDKQEPQSDNPRVITEISPVCRETRLSHNYENINKDDIELENTICCEYCPMNFNETSSYKLHLRNNHNIWGKVGWKNCSTSNTCFKCGLEYSCRKTLIRHEKFVHGQTTRDNRCLVCGRTFLKTFYLKSHTRTHQGIFPFRCLQCDKVFRKQAQLYNHVKSHKKL